MSSDVQTRMYYIQVSCFKLRSLAPWLNTFQQDNEIQQLRDLTDLLDLELSFVSQYHEILAEVRKDWVDE